MGSFQIDTLRWLLRLVFDQTLIATTGGKLFTAIARANGNGMAGVTVIKISNMCFSGNMCP